MAQLRYYNYGGALDNESEKVVQYALNAKGVYRGFSLSVDTNNNLVLGDGYGLQYDGVVWTENASITFVFTAPAVATIYTLVATHEDRTMLGGVPVVYELEVGELTNDDVSDGVVLGWIHHPGGGTPLIQAYITEAPKYIDEDYAALVAGSQPLELIPPFTRCANSLVGPNITFTETEFDTTFYLTDQKIENSPTAVPAVQQLVQNFAIFVHGSLRPVSIHPYVYFASTPLTNVTVEVFDTNQAPVAVTGGTIMGSGVWAEHSVIVDQTSGTFDDGKPYTVRLTYNVNKGEYVKVGRLVVSFWPYPV
jgi:hypothetical protein